MDHVVDTHVNVLVRTKRDHFSKYDPKRSNHANFQLLKIKNKKVMTKKPQIVENTNPLKKKLVPFYAQTIQWIIDVEKCFVRLKNRPFCCMQNTAFFVSLFIIVTSSWSMLTIRSGEAVTIGRQVGQFSFSVSN